MAIPPSPCRRSRARARRQANRAAASTSRLPATAAAAISPTECPITAAGVRPRDRQVWARATWVAKVNACTSTPLHGPPAVSASRGVQPSLLAEHLGQRVDGGGEDRLVAQQLPAHARPLRAVPGEDPDHRGRVGPPSGPGRPAGRTCRRRPPAAARRVPRRGGQHGGPLRQVRAALRQGVPHRRQGRPRVLHQPVGGAAGQRRHPGLGHRRERDTTAGPRRRPRPRRCRPAPGRLRPRPRRPRRAAPPGG